jgi:hypothetical protein
MAEPYRSQLSQGIAALPGASAEDFGAAIGRGLEDAGNDDRPGSPIKEARQRSAAAGVELAQASTEIDKAAIDARATAAPGGEGHTAAIEKLLRHAQPGSARKDPRSPCPPDLHRALRGAQGSRRRPRIWLASRSAGRQAGERFRQYGNDARQRPGGEPRRDRARDVARHDPRRRRGNDGARRIFAKSWSRNSNARSRSVGQRDAGQGSAHAGRGARSRAAVALSRGERSQHAAIRRPGRDPPPGSRGARRARTPGSGRTRDDFDRPQQDQRRLHPDRRRMEAMGRARQDLRARRQGMGSRRRQEPRRYQPRDADMDADAMALEHQRARGEGRQAHRDRGRPPETAPRSERDRDPAVQLGSVRSGRSRRQSGARRRLVGSGSRKRSKAASPGRGPMPGAPGSPTCPICRSTK